MAIVVVLAILFSCILLILCLPITYALTIHIGTPFQAREAGAGSWPMHPGPIPWAKNRITSCIPAGSAALP